MTKAAILDGVRAVLLEKQQQLQAMLDDLNEGIANDTKSSAGDKYETARSMSQQEIDKVSVQLQETGRQLALLPGLENTVSSGSVVQNGSLVGTDTGLFFIGIPAGQITIGAESVFCIGAAAPVAQLLIGKTAGETYVWNGRSHTILTIA